eukprot:GHVU01186233.1.p1 GENE.GHVU01186233.1~~GHVU01186233.1.p1  ORF type:complete len:116 (-),score=2.74 GHVU01186233.1:260-607(-)
MVKACVSLPNMAQHVYDVICIINVGDGLVYSTHHHVGVVLQDLACSQVEWRVDVLQLCEHVLDIIVHLKQPATPTKFCRAYVQNSRLCIGIGNLHVHVTDLQFLRNLVIEPFGNL